MKISNHFGHPFGPNENSCCNRLAMSSGQEMRNAMTSIPSKPARHNGEKNMSFLFFRPHLRHRYLKAYIRGTFWRVIPWLIWPCVSVAHLIPQYHRSVHYLVSDDRQRLIDRWLCAWIWMIDRWTVCRGLFGRHFGIWCLSLLFIDEVERVRKVYGDYHDLLMWNWQAT